jgi:hypothetical protein
MKKRVGSKKNYCIRFPELDLHRKWAGNPSAFRDTNLPPSIEVSVTYLKEDGTLTNDLLICV